MSAPHSSPAASADALRKGWCPGALRPMPAEDGLIVRLRIPGGIVPAPTAATIVDLATRYGNGLLDLSARGNLQLRGVHEADWPALVAALQTHALVDGGAEAEAVRNIIASPLAGLHDGLDIRPLVRALDAALATEAALWELPAKFGVLVDDGAQPTLADVAADLRFDWRPDAGLFSIGLGGTRAGAARIGTCGAARLVEEARRVAIASIALFARHPPARRLRSLIDGLGADAVAQACGGALAAGLAAQRRPGIVGHRRLAGRDMLGLGVPFGRLDAPMLRDIAAFAPRDLRLTPWRTILVPNARPTAADLTRLRGSFILDEDDARLAVQACVGREGCARATTSTHADAAALAGLAAATGTLVHVSGCAKGCARAEAAPFTLVGRDARYDLVRNGRAGDAPIEHGLDLAQVRAHLTREPVT